jgi:hypothetical protein
VPDPTWRIASRDPAPAPSGLVTAVPVDREDVCIFHNPSTIHTNLLPSNPSSWGPGTADGLEPCSLWQVARYFAFGSNLSFEQMCERCGPVDRPAAATLEAHRLVFAGTSRNWRGGGVATILPSSSHVVHGALYELDDEVLARLDRFEGSYVRRLIVVDRVPAWTYVRRDATPRRRPAAEYVAIMAHAYGEHGHPLSALLDALTPC